ncbi:hypothetical protein RIF29_19749 [Crotalaria pallida]|uniref:Uncharacterized protein n=1 Tax=Crotalaria pallida TaxID=3830 RepID=A0AAN9I801_CROPI
MAKKRGKQQKSPSPSSKPSSSHDNKSKDKTMDPSPIRLGLLEDQETEFQELFDNINGLSDKQAVSVLEKLDRIREKINGKQPMKPLNVDEDERSKDGVSLSDADQMQSKSDGSGTSASKPSEKITKRVSVQEQVNSGLIPSDRVQESELHPLVVETGTASQPQKEPEPQPVSISKDVPKEQEWHTVTRRRAQMQKSSDVGNKGSEGVGPGPTNG